MLHDEDSAVDLFLRGLSRDDILARTGVDVGYRGASLRSETAGIDRVEYAAWHVRQRRGTEAITVAGAQYAAGLPHRQVLQMLGLDCSSSNAGARTKAVLTALGIDVSQRVHAPTSTFSGLFAQDSADDLACRGFSREQILERTGEDLGGPRSVRRNATRGIDVLQYAAEHVRSRVTAAEIDQVLESYATGSMQREGAMLALGIGDARLSLATVFDALGMSERFAAAERSVRAIRAQEVTDRAHTPEANAKRAEALRARAADPAVREQDRARRTATLMDRYGVDAPLRSAEIRRRVQETTVARHGVKHHNQRLERRQALREAMTPERMEAMRSGQREFVQANPEHYSEAFSAWWADAEHARQVARSRRENGTWSTSQPEEDLYALLVEHFGEDDIRRQYDEDPRYPAACDFYIPSRDLFIELNATWTHGGHWYDAADPRDQRVVERWRTKGTAYFDNAVVTWTQRDVAKREHARRADLNYVVFWDGRMLADARLWLALGAPDGRDGEREHSWLPHPVIDLDHAGLWPDALDATSWHTASAAARAANWRTFFARELALWEDDRSARLGSVRGHLYANRYRYLNKLPTELSGTELLRGMSIAGLLRGFTIFRNTGMVQVLRELSPTSIYDPCAGWGERLATCAALGIGYEGVDINADVIAGHRRIIERYGLTEQHTCVGDAAQVDRRESDHEMVFTCPPYGDIEIYTEQGAENLDEPDFLAWWGEVVRLSTGPRTRVFAYQINQRWKDRMNAVLEAAGWSLIDQIAVAERSASHFQRGRGGVVRKREFEEVQVFVREV